MSEEVGVREGLLRFARGSTVGRLTAAGAILCACGTVGSLSRLSTAASADAPTCSLGPSAPRLTLTYSVPTAKLSVPVGDRFEVLVPRWHWGHASSLENGNTRVVRQVCSLLPSSGGRRAVFEALRVGVAHLSATVTPPSNLMMPAFAGDIIVTRKVASPLTTSLSLDRVVARAGSSLTAKVSIANSSRASVTVNACASAGWLWVGLVNGRVSFAPAASSTGLPTGTADPRPLTVTLTAPSPRLESNETP